MRATKNIKRTSEYRQFFYDNSDLIVPKFSDDLDEQSKIEFYIFYTFLKGYEKGNRDYRLQIADLKHQRKVLLERIRGLEALLKEYINEKFDKD